MLSRLSATLRTRPILFASSASVLTLSYLALRPTIVTLGSSSSRQMSSADYPQVRSSYLLLSLSVLD